MKRRSTSILTGLLASFAAGAPPAAANSQPGMPVSASPPAHSTAPNAVIEWNRTLLAIVRTKTPQPLQPATIHPTRAFAMLHLGIYDAVVAVTGGKSYVPERTLRAPASPTAAADQAAHDVLVALYPTQRGVFDGELASDLATLPSGPPLTRGIRAGQAAASAILAGRAQDGSAAPPPPYMLPAGSGVFEPPAGAVATFTHWAAVKPFVLARANQFRPPAPAPLSSPAYLAAVRQVQSLGRSNSTTRSAEQTAIATFWGGNIWDYWNEIAQSASLARRDSLVQDARLFAQLNTSFADSVIAFYDAKYTYHLWRPVTAIQTGFPGFAADPGWTSLGKAPTDPSYPGAHAAISQAAATVLDAFFHGDSMPLTVTSEVMPGTTRQFTGFAAAAAEASASRVFAGVHTQLDEEAGQRLGAKVAGFVLHEGPIANEAASSRRASGTRRNVVSRRHE